MSARIKKFVQRAIHESPLLMAVLIFPSLLCLASAGLAQAPYYQGKTITIVRGSAPGGVGEMRTRAVANYLKKYVPGNPTQCS